MHRTPIARVGFCSSCWRRIIRFELRGLFPTFVTVLHLTLECAGLGGEVGRLFLQGEISTFAPNVQLPIAITTYWMSYKPRSIRLLLSTFLLALLLSQCAAKSPSGMTSKRPILKRPPIHRVVGDTKAQTAHEELVADLIDTGKELLGKPYGYRGNLPWRMDCSGFVSYVYSRYGITVPRGSATQANYVKQIKREEILPGDLLFFKGRNRNSARVGHVAMVIDVVDGDPVMMHSTNSRGIIIERLSRSAYFSSRYLSAGRVPEMNDLIEEGSVMVPEPKLSPIAPNHKLDPVDIDRENLLPEISVSGPIQWRR